MVSNRSKALSSSTVVKGPTHQLNFRILSITRKQYAITRINFFKDENFLNKFKPSSLFFVSNVTPFFLSGNSKELNNRFGHCYSGINNHSGPNFQSLLVTNSAGSWPLETNQQDFVLRSHDPNSLLKSMNKFLRSYFRRRC